MAQLEENAALASARDKGTKEGLEQGKKEGEKASKEKMVRKLYELKTPIESIMEITELTKEEIEEILNNK